MKDNKLWFKARRFGFGWYPATWEGFVVIGVYLIVLIALFWGVPDDAPLIVIWPRMLILGMATILLIAISYKKGEKPGWRWGGKKRTENEVQRFKE